MEHSGLPDRRVIVLTDMQSGAFAGRAGTPEATPPPEIMFADFGTDSAARANMGVKSVTVPEFALEGEPAPVCFELLGGERGSRPAVSLAIDGRPRGEQSVVIGKKSGTSAAASGCFRPVFDKAGRHYGWISVQGVALAQDNTYYFSFEVSPRINVLILSDAASLDDPAKDAFYIDRALRAAASAGAGAAPFIYRAVPPGALTRADLSDARVVIVPSEVELGWDAARRLREFMFAGGGVLIFSDGRATPGDVTDRLFFGGDTVLAQPRESASGAARREFVNAGSFDSAYPAFAGLERGAAAEIASTRFYSAGRLTVNSPQTRVMMRLSDGSPVLVERRQGAGAAVLLACGINPYSSNVALKPYFVPFLARMVKRLGGARAAGKRNFVIGEDVRISLPERVAGKSLVAHALAGRGGDVMLSAVPGGDSEFVAAARPAPGVYGVVQPSRRGGYIDMFAVNFDSAEGDLARIGMPGVMKKFAAYPVSAADARSRFPVERVAAWAYNKDFTYLWIPFALLALGFMALDTVVSNRR